MNVFLAILLAAALFALAAWLKPRSCSHHCSACPADCVLRSGEPHE